MIPDIILAPDTLATRQLSQRVPANVPVGEYSYYVKIGEFPHELVDCCGFYFAKEREPEGTAPEPDDRPTYEWDSENFSSISHLPEKIQVSISPNPFNPSTVISFELKAASWIKLAVYDIQGREVVRLVDEWTPAGTYQMTFDASRLSSGIYFAHLVAGDFQQTRKLLLLK